MNPRALLILALASPLASGQSEITLEVRDIDLAARTFAVYADIGTDLAGFQFDITGVTLTNTHGGLAGDANFQTSFNADNGRVLSFGWGTQIDAGSSGDLLLIDFDCLGDDCSAGATICITNAIFSDPGGIVISTGGDTCADAGLGTSYCTGDGSATVCPCSNPSTEGGCANSTGGGGILTAYGSASVSADDLSFAATGLIPSQPVLLFVGNNAVNSGAGNPFGDGLRCAGGGVRRLGVRFCDAAGSANWSAGLGSSGGWAAGDIQRFQGWYRDAGGPCGATFNLTQGIELTFQS